MYATVLIVIALVLVAVSVQRTLLVKGKDDFMVAGRKLAWPVLVFTLLSSWIGSGSLFGGAESAYQYGFAALWIPAGGWAGLLVIYFIAARARRFAQFTVPDLLEARYDPFARIFGTFAIVISYVGITSYQFIGGGDVLNLIFPEAITPMEGRYIIAAFVVLFTAMAGMSSVAYLDLIIGLLATIMAIVALPILIAKAGGWAGISSALPADHFTVLGSFRWYQALNYFLPTFLLLLGNQAMYQKFFSARSERDARFSVTGWLIGTLILETAIVTLAVVGSAIYRDIEPRTVVPVGARLGMPEFLGALLMGGIFGQVLSTANNFLFSPASNLIHDVYHRFVRPRAGDREILIASRLIVVVLGGIALLLAVSTQSVLSMMLYAYTVYGAAITPVVLAAFFWKRANRYGALASILSGTFVTILWNAAAESGSTSTLGRFWDVLTGAHGEGAVVALANRVDAVIPALLVSAILLVAVSFVTAPPPAKKWQAVMAE